MLVSPRNNILAIFFLDIKLIGKFLEFLSKYKIKNRMPNNKKYDGNML